MGWSELIARWGADGPVRGVPGGLSVTFEGMTPAEITAQEKSPDEVELVLEWHPPWRPGDAAASLFPLDRLAHACAQARSGLLHCTATSQAIQVRMTLYLEGLSRQSFVGVAAEMARAVTFLDEVGAEAGTQASELQEAERLMAEAQRSLEEAESKVASAPAGTGEARPEARAAAPEKQGLGPPPEASPPPSPPPPPNAAHAWQPTHRIAKGGEPAWSTPDPARAPVSQLNAGLEVQVSDEASGWANIICSNGWSGWVRAQSLTPLRGRRPGT
ncbi:hypothetical protein E6W39_08990 [Kitasatospora acidiphila]|uniref:SH3 domain-containing protein n=1 Tax=Kitasatospora acidiphila TaxID=2567942 RepID=A0A540W227_9ACTN|nr:hypothetical protein [Kitasatospora acidiphila]TQF02384.1 hypothetical protein E6W39_08990 [Kitasatospora acidiphila]